MQLIKIEIQGSNSQIEKFLRNITQKISGALVFEVTRVPCVGETIRLGTDERIEIFLVTRVLHYTFPSWCSAWGRITVELLGDSPDDMLPDLDNDILPELVPDLDNDILPELVPDLDDDILPELVPDLDDDILPELVPDLDDDILPELVPDDDLPEDEIEDLEDLEYLEDDYTEDNFLKNQQRRSYFGRIPRGICTPEKAYKLPILKALQELGGSGTTNDVLKRVKKLMKGVLKLVDYQNYENKQGFIEPRWSKRAKWVRYRLMQEGLVKNDSPRGLWEISEAGLQYLAKGHNKI